MSSQAESSNAPPQAIARSRARARRTANQVPEEILNDSDLKEAISILPANYNFEVYKTIWRIKKCEAKCVALQFPEGLLAYACHIADIVERFTCAKAVIMGDVTYGACCVDDFSAAALGADIMIHYGHSCLVPVDTCKIPVMYVFVDIRIDTEHFVETVKFNFPPESKLAVMATIQFVASLQLVKSELSDYYGDVLIPQAKPLSSGEVLGCTAPTIEPGREILVFLADGRFHLEAAMIANPALKAYRYDPYSKKLTLEEYDHSGMRVTRKQVVSEAAEAKTFGIVLGTLGRQGNPKIVERMEHLLRRANKEYFIVLLSEIFPDKIATFRGVDAWIEIACPRLAIDWGTSFRSPVLTPYEAEIALGAKSWEEQYPMDYYAKDGGAWTNYYKGDRTVDAEV